MKKRILAVVLVVVMILMLMPSLALAATTTVTNSGELNAAIAAAADGDIINIDNGTYALMTKTIIDKDLTLVGESEAGVLLNPTANTGSSGDDRGWIVVNTDKTLTISNLTMDGTGFNVHQAIRANGAVIADSVTILNIRFGLYTGFGMALMGGGNVTNITMSNIERVGITIYGGVVRHDTVVDGFSFTGTGAVDGVNYAIEVGAYPATAVPFQVDIINVTISDCLAVALSDGSASAGILISTFFYADGSGVDVNLIDVNIDKANFSNCTTGVVVGYTDAYNEHSVTSVTNSNFFNCESDLDYVGIVTTGSFTTAGNYYGGAPVTYLGDGNVITGVDTYLTSPVPIEENTEVTAGIDPSFMIIIPAAVDFGTLIKNSGIQAQAFPVEAQGVVIETGYEITVGVSSDFTMLDLDGLGSVPLAYLLYNSTPTLIADTDEFSAFDADRVENGTVEVDTSLITAAGSYKGTMDFAIAYEAK